MLLVRPGEPRSVWERRAHDPRPGIVDHAAVAGVVNRAARQPLSPETIAAAVEGAALSAPTLDRFIDAFNLNGRHATRLRDLLRGSDAVRVITGSALSDLRRQIGPPRHETLAVHELHTLGPDGLPAEHQTIQVIKSTVDSLETYPFRFDTDQLAVEVVRGGHVGDLYRFDEHLFGFDIVLDRPLAAGETTLLHYRLTFLYRTAPPTEFRRGVLGTMRDVTLWVQFHPQKVPARVWQARWDRLDHAAVIEEQVVELDGELSAQARYDRVDDSILGFRWSWE